MRVLVVQNYPNTGLGQLGPALAAGHRPCFLCRRDKALEFAGCFGIAFGVARPRAPEMDRRLHAERPAAGAVAPILELDAVASLPDGAMIGAGGEAFAIRDGKVLRWSFAGYSPAGRLRESTPPPVLLTPPATVAVLRAGYRPVWHGSAAVPA